MLLLRLSFLKAFLFLLFLTESVALAAGIPPRPPGSKTGSEFIASTRNMGAAERELAILAELQKGNVPSFLRELKPVEVTVRGQRRGAHRARVWVMPDYLAIGSDADFVRIPMTPITAQKVADAFGFVLPTSKIVDEVNRQADVKLSPSPLPHGRRMTSNDYYLKHDQIVERQFRKTGKHEGALTAGHKKDVIITNRLVSRPKQVAIYGWHRRNGKPIQPVSLVHDQMYADYSHGVRLVSREAEIDGRKTSIEEILTNARYAPLLSYEGRMRTVRARTDGLRDVPHYGNVRLASARGASTKKLYGASGLKKTRWQKSTSKKARGAKPYLARAGKPPQRRG